MTSGGGIPLVEHLNVALSPSLTVSLFMGLSNTGATRSNFDGGWVSEHYNNINVNTYPLVCGTLDYVFETEHTLHFSEIMKVLLKLWYKFT